MKTVGIIGGLGPETTSEFYLYLINKFRKTQNFYPSIVIDNVSFPFELEREIILESKNTEKMLPYLFNSIDRLNKTSVDFIVMPCNTLHIFIDKIRNKSNVPFINIIDETVKVAKNNDFRKIGLLATTKTIESKIYQNALKNGKSELILPTEGELIKLSNIEINILRNKVSVKNSIEMSNIMRNLIDRGADSIVLGCTDFQLVIDQRTFEVEIFDSMKILAEATYEYLVNNATTIIK